MSNSAFSDDIAIERSVAGMKLSNQHRIIIGVDFGTTYTGVSYIDSTTSKTSCSVKDVKDVRTWPGPGREADAVWKTPSRIAYSSENDGLTANAFGYQVTPKMKSYSWTKLLLDQSARATEFDDPSLRKTEGEGMLKLPPGKTAGEVVTDFLREIYRWIVDQLTKRISAEILNVTPVEFWFTVPAIWSEQAKSITLSAASNAGFACGEGDSIQLIPEPEAAGLATLKGLSEETSIASVSPGDGILICDCGGGTVDITSYKVLEVSPKLIFEELVEGIGGKCGSTYIDRAFHRWMSTTFGPAFDALKFEKIGPGSRFMKDFESHKRDFGYSSKRDHEYNIDFEQVYELNLVIPGAVDCANYESDESVVKITGHTMLSFFEPVIQTIIALLKRQIETVDKTHKSGTVKRVVLVGGFGDSPYLNHRVRQWCQTSGMTALCPADPQAVIARGAALRGLECVAPIKRKSRRHYGITCDRSFREGIDLERDSAICDWSGVKLCARRVEWFIAKGDVIDEHTKIVLDRWRTYEEGEALAQDITLYSCASDVAPEYTWNDDVEEVACLKHTVDRDELRKCEKKRIGGKKRWRIYFQREIYLGTQEGTLTFKVVRNGKVWGQAEVQYDTKQGDMLREQI